MTSKIQFFFQKQKFYFKPVYELESVWKENISRSVQLQEWSVYKK
jgi:hypothetical protein